MECQPFDTSAIAAHPTIESWRAAAPGMVAAALERWNLEAGDAFLGGVAASVLRVVTSDGTPAVLKIGFPHREAIWEAVGLAVLPEGLGPSVLAQHAEDWALLLETITPGVPLRDVDVPAGEALEIAGSLHRRLVDAVVPPGVPTLAEAWSADIITDRHRLREQAFAWDAEGVLGLLTSAIDDLDRLTLSDSARALLHGDYNPGNILSSDGRGWQVIDPKPMIGDPAYDLWPLVSQVGTPFESASALARQIDAAAASAEVDPARVAGWGFALTGVNLIWKREEGEPVDADLLALRRWAEVAGR